jgi:hypothetical protein
MTLLGIGAMASLRYRPAGPLVEYGKARVMIDGGPSAAPTGPLDRKELLPYGEIGNEGAGYR